MSEKMSAFRMLEWGKPPQIVEVDVPQAGPGQVLVKVAGAGVCGIDPKMQYLPEEVGSLMGWNMPFTLGHETGGWIEQVGDGVRGFEVGEPVVLMNSHSCGRCSFCLEGAEFNCIEHSAGRGYGRDGALAKYVLVESPREIIKLESLDPTTAAPLVDAGAISYHGVSRLLPRLKPGSTAVVIGVGGLGSFAVQFLKVLSAARVIAIDTNPARLDYACDLGADEVINSVEVNAAEVLRQLAPEGVHAAMDFVGSDATIGLGVGALRAGGAFALVGAALGKLDDVWYTGLPKNGEVFTYEGATIAETTEVVRLAEQGKISNDVELFPFDEVELAYEKLARGELRGRAVIQMAD